MENIISILVNSTDDIIENSSLPIREFPYWQPTLAAILLLLTISHASSILIIYVPLLVVLLRVVKKDHFKPLNLLHASLVIASIFEDIGRIILYPIYLPSAFRHCVCSASVNSLLGVLFTFFLIYRPFCFASLSVLQFLVVIGKKKFVTLKVSFGMIAVCSGLAAIYTAATVKPTYDTIEKYVCYESFCPNSRSESPLGFFAITFMANIFIAFLPSIFVVLTMSIWSCAVFRNYYTGGDDQLNRRMLSLPFIMPLGILASSSVEGAQIILVGIIISMLSSLGDLFPYWIMFTNFLLASFLRFFIRLVYPSVLLYTHRKLRRAFKRLVRDLKNRKFVTPGTVNIDSTTVGQ